MNEPRIEAAKEYETLRNELLQGKKYVFERPILIITASLALVKFENQYAVYLPSILIGLLFFNLWFTVNRLGSMARISAYIQLILEDKNSIWIGWETSLRYHRRWLKSENTSAAKIKIDDAATYDHLGFYRTIYFMHIVVTILVFLILAVFTVDNFEWKNIVLTLLTLGLLTSFIKYAIKNTPKDIKQQIEKHRHIWIIVFSELEKLTSEGSGHIISIRNDN